MKRRKNIDLDDNTFKMLSHLAVSSGVSLKAYIELSLTRIANSVSEDATLLQLSGQREANIVASADETAEIWSILENSDKVCK